MKLLEPDDAVAEEDVLFAELINSPDAYSKGMVKVASLGKQMITTADLQSANFAMHLVMKNQGIRLMRVSEGHALEDFAKWMAD